MTADGKSLVDSEKIVSKFLDLLPNSTPFKATTWNAQFSSANEAIVVPTQVRIF